MNDTPEATPAPTKTSSASSISRSAWQGTVLAVVAALGIWGVTNAKYPYYEVDAEKYGIGMSPPREKVEALLEQQEIMAKRNMSITFAIAGGLLSAALSLVAQGCCAWPVRMVSALPWGILWGAGTGFVGVIIFNALMPKSTIASATGTGLSQGAVFAVLGFGVGLMYGGFTKSLSKTGVAAIGGALGGFGGAMLYPIIAAIVAASASTQEMVPPTSTVRLLWLVIPFAAIGFLVPMLTNQPLTKGK